MNIGDRYKVEVDSHNFILKEIKDKKKKDDEADDDFENREAGWTIVGYFYDFKKLLKFLVDNEVKHVGLNDLLLLNQKQEELYNLILSLKTLTIESFHINAGRGHKKTTVNA
jgi:hypothetical protein